jgi:hypothetical protein
MTLAEILSNGYGIDLSTLRFELRTDLEFDDECPSKEEILKSINEDEMIMNGKWIDDFDIVPDEPNGYIEFYSTEDDLEDLARISQYNK